uniref:Granulins domain-containing protein n=1 Tax=Astyanax mexicanus TaxID=7994 RepID=A0A3B1IFJ0_ASTMX
MLAVLVLLMAQLVSSAPDSPPSAVESTEPSVQWCDFKSYCPDCSTCCKNKAGVWTCCGKCCADGIHCYLSLPSFPQRPAVTANHTMPREIKVLKISTRETLYKTSMRNWLDLVWKCQ